MSFFSGVQQIGVGVTNAEAAKDWFAQHLKFSVQVFDDVARAEFMKAYTANKVGERRAILSMQKTGGGGLEIWQFLDRKTQPQGAVGPNSLGILGAIVGNLPMNSIQADVAWTGSLGTTDFDGNLFLAGTAIPNGKDGVRGAAIGVSNLEKSKHFYCDILGFELFKEEDLMWNGVPGKLVTLYLQPKQALFSHLLGSMELKLVWTEAPEKKHLFEGRSWGDQGFIHLCFETPEMDAFKDQVSKASLSFSVDSGSTFAMSDAGGRFGYIEDPDGTLIELVETHKIPISKRHKWALSLQRYKNKPIPKWQLKLMGLFQ